ncbi:hypothetical protein D5018_04930 [Parashewanella curva]|uniref:Uncharacterized protein n=1 Tax=Parashewanella curva TaxID=2338552 RepID=A0A3L8Q2T8_9GAMM|nr:hypothetical protein [Parashewanella curva]RLV60812.1 hypothetical protein D5018_04930 [Parashewanella curva]
MPGVTTLPVSGYLDRLSTKQIVKIQTVEDLNKATNWFDKLLDRFFGSNRVETKTALYHLLHQHSSPQQKLDAYTQLYTQIKPNFRHLFTTEVVNDNKVRLKLSIEDALNVSVDVSINPNDQRFIEGIEPTGQSFEEQLTFDLKRDEYKLVATAEPKVKHFKPTDKKSADDKVNTMKSLCRNEYQQQQLALMATQTIGLRCCENFPELRVFNLSTGKSETAPLDTQSYQVLQLPTGELLVRAKYVKQSTANPAELGGGMSGLQFSKDSHYEVTCLITSDGIYCLNIFKDTVPFDSGAVATSRLRA